MDILALFAALLDISSFIPGGRVTVAERYKMKKRVRELKKREAKRKSAPRG